MSKVNGFDPIPWPQLKAALLALPPLQSDLELNPAEKVTDHASFIHSHISMVDTAPEPNKDSGQIARRRRLIVPYYTRLLIYYNLRIRLIEA